MNRDNGKEKTKKSWSKVLVFQISKRPSFAGDCTVTTSCDINQFKCKYTCIGIINSFGRLKNSFFLNEPHCKLGNHDFYTTFLGLGLDKNINIFKLMQAQSQ